MKMKKVLAINERPFFQLKLIEQTDLISTWLVFHGFFEPRELEIILKRKFKWVKPKPKENLDYVGGFKNRRVEVPKRRKPRIGKSNVKTTPFWNLTFKDQLMIAGTFLTQKKILSAQVWKSIADQQGRKARFKPLLKSETDGRFQVRGFIAGNRSRKRKRD